MLSAVCYLLSVVNCLLSVALRTGIDRDCYQSRYEVVLHQREQSPRKAPGRSQEGPRKVARLEATVVDQVSYHTQLPL